MEFSISCFSSNPAGKGGNVVHCNGHAQRPSLPSTTKILSANGKQLFKFCAGYCGIQWDESTLTAPKGNINCCYTSVVGD